MTARHPQRSRREPLVIPINGSAIPETLIESELFGHENGAVAGAHTQRKGRIELAESGTLFLDEIGDVLPPIQVKLRASCRSSESKRVGGPREIEVTARVIAAINADPNKRMLKGGFCENLFYRLAAGQITMPALRDRDDDVLMLARAFLQRCAAENDQAGMVFAADATRAFRQHTWPGNVRELQNRSKRAVIIGDGKRITPQDLELNVSGEASPDTSVRGARAAQAI